MTDAPEWIQTPPDQKSTSQKSDEDDQNHASKKNLSKRFEPIFAIVRPPAHHEPLTIPELRGHQQKIFFLTFGNSEMISPLDHERAPLKRIELEPIL